MANIQEDNVYRRSVPVVRPIEQQIDDNKEKIAVLNQYGLIKDVIERLKADVTYYDTNQGVSDDVLTNPAEFMHVVAGNKKAVASINREIEELEALVTAYAKR